MIRIAAPSRRDVLKGGSAITLGGALGIRAAHAREISARQKELHELARKEGEITWYTAHSNDTTAQALGRDFEAAFPGIKANVVRTTAQVAYQRLTQEQRAGAMQVDVFSSTDIGHYVALKEKNLLEKFVAERDLKWPEYFDGKMFQNEISQKYGINAIPAMWLVDKKGNLRDMNARGALEEKVLKLLQE